ncbi:MAG TPA: PorP/SprF family type IX secretion system membrane protein [Haliscomenobacter sp.]|nr:PorP/SprF family type IX secretion system membrane protein [Haliscomenobacter sp.]
MRKLLTLVLGACWGLAGLHAQQSAQYTLHMLSPYYWNSGAAAIDQDLSLTASVRQQWGGLPGAPMTQFALLQVPLPQFRAAFGVKFENDELGAQRNSNLMATYNYQLELGSGILGLGASAGFTQYGLDGSQLRTPGGAYQDILINHNDDILSAGAMSGLAPTFDLGAYYQSEKWSFGVAMRNLTSASIQLSEFELQTTRTVFFNGQTSFPLGTSFLIQPSVLVRTDLTQIQTDVGLLIRYNDNIFGGASFRGYNSNSIDALGLIAGAKLNEKLSIAYAYDLVLSPLREVSNGSHELMVHYRIQQGTKSRKPKIIYNPRLL